MTINKINGKFYIGKHKADAYDPNYYGSGIALEAAIKKYGKENFTNFMICAFDTLEELNAHEKFCINYLYAQEIGYNIAPGGDGGVVWGDPSNHPSLGKHGLKGDKNPMFGKTLPLEVRERINEELRGRKRVKKDGIIKMVHPEELQQYIDDGWICPSLEEEKRRAKRLEEIRIYEETKKQKNQKQKKSKKQNNNRLPSIPKTGWHHTEESKKKISESEKKTKSNPEFKEKFSQAVKDGIANMSEEKRLEFKEKCRQRQLGKKHTEQSKQKLSETLKEGYKTGKYTPSRKGKPSWNKGLKVSEEQKQKLSEMPKGRIHITNGEINKMIYPDELSEWETKGFYRGRTIHKHNKEEKEDA